MWRLTKGAGQTVAVIDTGVARHRLLPHLLPGGDYVSTGDGTQDCDGHGTIVAGIIGAARSDARRRSAASPPMPSLMAIRQSSNVFRPAAGERRSGVGDVETLAAAVRTAADAGATVVNISSVACAPADRELDDRSLGAALSYAVDVKNVVVVAAAGNVGGAGQCPRQNPAADPARPGRPSWDTVQVVVSPAWYDDYVLTVGSVDRTGRPSAFTLSGPWVDVAAPGEAVVSLSPDGDGLTDVVPDLSEPATDFGYQLRGAGGRGYRRAGAVGVARADRAAGDAPIEDTAHHPAPAGIPSLGHGIVDALAAVEHRRGSPPRADAARAAVAARHRRGSAADTTVRRVALVGAAAAWRRAAALTLSGGRLRRRQESVAND